MVGDPGLERLEAPAARRGRQDLLRQDGAELGLAARALDGSDDELASSVDVQLEALVSLLTDALTEAASQTA